MDTIRKIFNIAKPIIAMLHLDYLDGKKFDSIYSVSRKALRDLKTLQDNGVDGLLIENWKEESLGEFVSYETARNFEAVMQKVTRHINVPFGLNILNNDYKLAFSLAKKYKASFIEMDVFVDKVKSDFQSNQIAIEHPFIIDPNPKAVWNYAKSIDAQNIPLFCFVQPKHYKLLEKNKTIEKSTKEAIENGAKAILITKATGVAPTQDLIKKAKIAAQNIPVGIGSGFSMDNAKDYLPMIDFAVVGTSLKINGKTDNPVDPNKVAKLMNLVKSMRTQ